MPQAVLSTEQEKDQPLFLHLAPNWGLPSQYFTILLVRSYRTFAPLPDELNSLAVFFCGTFLAFARTGRYPASLVFRESGLSSGLLTRNLLANSLSFYFRDVCYILKNLCLYYLKSAIGINLM